MKMLTVTELTLAIKKLVEPPFRDIQVKGEVSNLRKQSSGHLYFTLKDGEAQIAAALFRGNAQRAAHLPKDGDKVVVRGELGLYAPRGSYQIVVREVEHAGVGALLMRLHQLKEELRRRGWLAQERKRPLPRYPQRIGVVTSPSGAVIQDIIHVLKRRYPPFQLLLYPVRVQGAEAAGEIAHAIGELSRLKLVDVMIVGRGGGSLEDLWPFNEEVVARAIVESTVPVISAVGHETDETIADYVADWRAPTPSAAAEIAVRELSLELKFLDQMEERLTQVMGRRLSYLRAQLKQLERHPFLLSPYAPLNHHYQRLDELAFQLERALRMQVERGRLKVGGALRELEGRAPLERIRGLKERMELVDQGASRAVLGLLAKKRGALEHAARYLEGINPKGLLKKGYCIPFAEKGGSVILSSKEARPGMLLSLRFHDGEVKTRVEEHDE